MEHGVTQTRIGWDAKLLRPASEVFMLRWMRGLRFNLKRHLQLKWGSHQMTCPWWFLDSL